MNDRQKNIMLISSQLYEFMDEGKYPLNEERIKALEDRLEHLFEEEFMKGYIEGRKEITQDIKENYHVTVKS